MAGRPDVPGRRDFVAGLVLAGLLGACGDERPRHAGPRPGMPFVPPAVQGLDGAAFAWQVGRPQLINFWATWCPPCRKEMPSLDVLYRQSRERGLEMLAVSVDGDLQLVREYVLQSALGFPVLFDRDGRGAKDGLGISVFPTTLLVSRNGVIADVVIGAREWDTGPARASVDALLA